MILLAGFSNPAATVGLAMAAGVLAQVVARHLLLPGIVLLLVVGVLLGPDVAGVIQPAGLGEALHMLVGFAVAVILFEGGMHLDLRQLRAEGPAIRRLVTIGAVITAVGGTLAARLFMGWDWRLSTLFGTLVIVTGPTVVTPLLRRLRLKEPVNTILEAEGVLIDPIGAIIAVVALEFLYAQGTTLTGGSGVPTAAGTAAVVLGTGGLIGLIGGIAMALLLRPHWLVPVGLENILVLSFVIALFQVADTVQPESGLAAVTVAGITVGNARTRVARELLDFKEQLTVLMIGLLFVLLAADVRLADVRALGWPAIATVAALMLVVRPVEAWLCTIGLNLGWRARTFIASMAPRGIVAAAVASLFAQQLELRPSGEADGVALRALVFLLIAVTVLVYGVAGGSIAALLRLRRPTGNGYVVLGANALSRALGRVLRSDGHEVVFIDSNVDRALAADREGFPVIYGQGLQASVLAQAEPESRLGCIALTPNEEVNLLFATKIREETRTPALFVALRDGQGSVQPENVHDARATILFGGSRRFDLWSDRLERGTAHVERWQRSSPSGTEDGTPPFSEEGESDALLLIAVRRRGRLRPFDDEVQLTPRDEIAVAISADRRDEAVAWLEARGFRPIEPAAEELIRSEG